MHPVVVVMPSRGRPQRAWEAVQAARDTAARVSTSIVLGVDEDDPELLAYRSLHWSGAGPAVSVVTLYGRDTGDLVKATNTLALRIAHEDPQAIIGNLGDDHFCRTKGWDRAIAAALEEPGVAYPDDGYQHEALPTAPFVSASIVRSLGWYFLPRCRHLYVDSAWRELGASIGRLHYLPDVLIEHMHPLAEKGAWDAGYERANNEGVAVRDRAAFTSWRRSRMYRRDVDRIRKVLA